jgi:hypothetical protein
MGQSRCGVTQVLEVQTHPLVVAIPRFIQIGKLLPSLKLMAQSRRGTLIDPSALRAAKAESVE